MYFGREIFAWIDVYFCVVDFRRMESTLFHEGFTLIGAECIKRKTLSAE